MKERTMTEREKMLASMPEVEKIAREIVPHTGAISVICGEVAVHYSGFNLSEFARRLRATPTPADGEALREAIKSALDWFDRGELFPKIGGERIDKSHGVNIGPVTQKVFDDLRAALTYAPAPASEGVREKFEHLINYKIGSFTSLHQEIAFKLCEEWQAAQHRHHGFAVDELTAFMSGVKASLRYVSTPPPEPPKPGHDTVAETVKLRGGPGFDFPCNDPTIIECAFWECQSHQRCRKSKLGERR